MSVEGEKKGERERENVCVCAHVWAHVSMEQSYFNFLNKPLLHYSSILLSVLFGKTLLSSLLNELHSGELSLLQSQSLCPRAAPRTPPPPFSSAGRVPRNRGCLGVVLGSLAKATV